MLWIEQLIFLGNRLLYPQHQELLKFLIMAKRLTTFSKFLITLAILAAIVFGGRWVLNNTEFGKNLQDQATNLDLSEQDSGNETPADKSRPAPTSKDNDDVLIVQLFTWGGYAPGLYFNEGWMPNRNSRYYKEYGLKVRFELIDDFNASRQAWKSDRVHLLGTTADALPTEMEGLMEYDPRIVLQCDWSRGGDAIIAQRGIKSINDLKNKKVAVTPSTPSQTFLIKMLDAANMTLKDIKVVEMPDNFAAATAFKSREVDAAVVWSPDDEVAVREVPGATILQSTRTASHIIADVFIAKESFVQKNKDKIRKFYEGWMKGAAEINQHASNKEKAAKYMAEGTAYAIADALDAINKVRLCTHGDNMNFFRQNVRYRGVTGENLYTEMGKRFEELGFAKPSRPTWQQVAYVGAAIDADANLKGAIHNAESQPEFEPAKEADAKLPAVATKPVSISFPSNSSTLGENAKTLIDLQFADIAKAFGNARIRIEGNTDSRGSKQLNKRLSLERAESVARYLEGTYGMDRNRFIIVGNGSDNPVPGCESNASEVCRARNRRTEFQIIGS